MPKIHTKCISPSSFLESLDAIEKREGSVAKDGYRCIVCYLCQAETVKSEIITVGWETRLLSRVKLKYQRQAGRKKELRLTRTEGRSGGNGKAATKSAAPAMTRFVRVAHPSFSREMQIVHVSTTREPSIIVGWWWLDRNSCLPRFARIGKTSGFNSSTSIDVRVINPVSRAKSARSCAAYTKSNYCREVRAKIMRTAIGLHTRRPTYTHTETVLKLDSHYCSSVINRLLLDIVIVVVIVFVIIIIYILLYEGSVDSFRSTSSREITLYRLNKLSVNITRTAWYI